MHNKNDNDTIKSMETTRSMKEKAKFVGRCLITMLKCFRMCKKTRKDKNKHKNDIL